MDRKTRRDVAVTLIKAGRRDLAVCLASTHWYVILMSRPKKAMRAIVTPILKKHRVWYRYTGGSDAHFSVEFRDDAQVREVTRELNEAVLAGGWPLGLEMYET